MDIRLLIALLPIVFVFHDFEEIIMFRPWLEKNRAEIKQRFPRIHTLFNDHVDGLSTSAYAVAVLHELFILALVTYLSLYFNSYHWWFAAFIAFSIHLLVHIVQWIIFGKYVPFILTSILALPYCAYVLIEFLKMTDLTYGQLLIWAGLGIILTIASLVPAFFLASRFEHWKNRIFLQRAA
jgi:Protein of unknown function with HXXEE motif